jgi:hypothetical protein
MRTTTNSVEAGALARHHHASWCFDDPAAVVGGLAHLLGLDRIDARADR